MAHARRHARERQRRGAARALSALALLVSLGSPARAVGAPQATSAASAQDARETLVAALEEAAQLAARSELEAALAALARADTAAMPRSWRALLGVRAAEFERALGRWSAARARLDAAQQVLGEKASTRQLRSYLHAVRAQVLLEQGLLDLASAEVERARELLLAVEAEGAAADPEHLQVDYAEASLLGAREDQLGLDAFVTRALASAVYARHPSEAAKLLARQGLGLAEAARLQPELAPRAQATLERALACAELAPLERVLPELGLAALALRAGAWERAEAALESAGAHLGPEPERAGVPQRVSWLAARAQLALERDDRSVERAELAGLRAELERASDASLAEWSARELRAGGWGFLQYTDQRALLGEWTRLVLALEGEGRGAELALERLARAADAGTLARRLEAPPCSLERARTSLLGPADEHALLVYLPTPERSHLLVADRASVVHVALASADELEQARCALARALETVQRPEPSPRALSAWSRALRELRELVLPEPARAALGSREHVTIVGADLLGDLPFAALPWGESTSFGRAHALSRLPSLAVGEVLVRRAASEPRAPAAACEPAACLLAAPRASGLSLARAEAEEMLAAYPAHARRVVFGSEASLAALARAREARVLELFTHGASRPARERPMVLLLERDPLDESAGSLELGADEVEELELPPLVVLAVCRSGRGPKRRGDAGAAQLDAAFFLAGARVRCVLASAFDLDAEATRRLTRSFHAGLVGGLAPDRALRAAREELARDARFAEARFHGLLEAVGAAWTPVFER